MADVKMVWGSGTMQHTFEVLERLAPLHIPLIIRKSEHIDDTGAWFDGESVHVSFHHTMPYGSVQLQVLTGYAVATGFHLHPQPRTKSDRADIHSAMMGVVFEVGRFDQTLADAFQMICIPQAMAYVDNAIARLTQMEEGKMN